MRHGLNTRLIDELNKIANLELPAQVSDKLRQMEGDILFTQAAKESVKSDLTMDDLERAINSLPPRMIAEAKLLAALKSFPVEAVYHLAKLVERGMFDFMKEPKNG
jgi:hypothetical protein